MAAQKDRFTPLNQDLGHRLDFQPNRLPQAITDRVGIDIPRTERLLQLSGFRRLTVEMGDNQAHLIDKMPPLARKQALWHDLSVSLDLPGIKQKIPGPNPYHQPASHWARPIDLALKKELLRAGTKNLIGGTSLAETLVNLGAYASIPLVTSLLAIRPTPLELGGYLLLITTVTTAIDSAVCGLERQGEGRRLSFFLGPELDRTLALAILGNLNRLVGEVT
jgi:hypothetical protein